MVWATGDSNQLSWFLQSQSISGCACERVFHTKSYISCWKLNHRVSGTSPSISITVNFPHICYSPYPPELQQILLQAPTEPIVLVLDFRGPWQRSFTAAATTSAHHFMQSVGRDVAGHLYSGEDCLLSQPSSSQQAARDANQSFWVWVLFDTYWAVLRGMFRKRITNIRTPVVT
jgi:hypothetical protein